VIIMLESVQTLHQKTSRQSHRLGRSCAARASRGFSLLELTLVIAIIGVLTAVVAFSLGGLGGRAKVRATEASLSTIQTSIKSYHLEYSSYPPDLLTLVSAKYLDRDKPLNDGWSKPFYYDPRGRSKEQPYVLMSAGEDGVSGNEDDIDVWTMLQKR
jgi:general secretion pathway protein G